MEAIEFRINGLVVEYRSLIVCSTTRRSPDGYSEYDGPLEENGYTEWRPLPGTKITVSERTFPSSYDCGARRVLS